MYAFVDIGNSGRLELDGDILTSIVLQREVGFIADRLTIGLNQTKIRDMYPEILHHTPKDRIKISANIGLDNGIEVFNGVIDDVPRIRKSNQRLEPQINVNCRSILADLLDEEFGGRITKIWPADTDFSAIVSEVVESRGFTSDRIEASGILAGEKNEAGRFVYRAENKLPGEIVTEAVGITKFIANTTPEKDFYFLSDIRRLKKYRNYIPEEFIYIQDDESSEILEINQAIGKIQSIVTINKFVLIPLGQDIQIVVMDEPFFSGMYQVRSITYTLNQTETSISYGVTRSEDGRAD